MTIGARVPRTAPGIFSIRDRRALRDAVWPLQAEIPVAAKLLRALRGPQPVMV